MAKDKNKSDGIIMAVEGELRNRLIKLREDAGYDSSQIADVLCLSKEVIKNLENEAVDLLPQPAYVHGYLRNYAKLGNEDPQELIQCYESLRGNDAQAQDYQIKASTTISTAPQKSMWGVWLQLILLGVLLSGVAMYLMIPSVKTWVEDKWNSFSVDLTQPTDASDNPSLLGELPVPVPLSTNNTNTEESTEQELVQNNTVTPTTLPTENEEAQENNTQVTPEPNETNEAEHETTSVGQSITDSVTNVGTSITETLNNLTSSDIVSTNNTDLDTTNLENFNDNNDESTQTVDNEENLSDQSETDISEAEVTTSQAIIAALSNTPGLTLDTNNESSSLLTDDPVSVKLVFNKEVWLRIKDKDSKTILEGLNKQGTNKTLNANKPLTFRVGNADGFALFVDDKSIDISAFINGSVANFTLD